MPTAGNSAAQAPIDGTRRRWEEMLGNLAELLPAWSRRLLIDGPADRAEFFASRLAEKLAEDRRALRLTLDADEAWDLAIFLRTPPDGPAPGEHGRRAREARADVVIDLHDVQWPVIRRVDAKLAACGRWYLAETRAFFACRAVTWDAKFGDDLPAYRAAVAEAGIRQDGLAIDAGCGTGRALPPLREAIGPAGTLFALDVTPEMLKAAHGAVLLAGATTVIADARALPFADAAADAIFAAGLVNHLPDTEAGLRELARVTSQGGLLILFHPSGRAALAARHGNALSPDEPLSEGPLRRFTAATGWDLAAYDDAPNRFFAVAERR